MSVYIPSILSLLVVLSIVAYSYWLEPWLERRRRGRIVPSTLQTLMANAGGQIHQLGEHRYEYSYQDGIFLLNQEMPHSFTITFPAFLSVDREELEAVRNLANRANQTYDGWSFFYHYNERKDELVLSLCTRFTLSVGGNADEAFRSTLRNCFELRHTFVSTYQKEAQEESDERAANSSRDKFLLHMREYALQPKADRTALSGRQLRELLRIVGEHDILEPLRLTIYEGERATVIADKEAILNYDLAQPILTMQQTEQELGGESLLDTHATLTLTYAPLHNHENKHLAQLTIVLERLATDQDLTLFRASIARPAYVADGTMAFVEDTNVDFATSVLLAYDGGRLEAREAELRYMWDDAKDKAKEKKFGELTEPQRLLLRVDEQPLGYNLYWGRKCSLTNRYVEAIVLLENAYTLLEERFESLTEAEKETFAEVLYHLCFCYNSIGNYAMAFFYISGLQGTRNLRYQREVVNTLVNMHDYRALQQIDRFLRRIDDMIENTEEGEENITLEQHRSFLYRRRLQALINANLLDEAEQFATRLRTRDDCREAAQEQLAEIARLRAIEATDRIAEALDATPVAPEEEEGELGSLP